VPVIVVEDPRQVLARAAALWWGAQPETAVAVTGTNGKTSVASFCRQLWTALGRRAVNLGTVGVEGAWEAPLRHTTPDPLTLHRVLAEARAAGVTHAALEASSHGLDQRRLDGVWLAAAGWTNLSQDHLDYHPDMEAYFEAKMGLFERLLPPDGVAVVNLDDLRGPEVAARAAPREVIGTGRAEGARLRLLDQRFDATGQDLRFAWQGRARQARLDLVGGFQASNVLVAAGLCIGAGEDPEEVLAALPGSAPCAAGCSSRPGVRTARACSWTTPTRPTRWRPRSRRCGPTPWGGSWRSSARAATATGASARSWARPPRGRQTWSS
jgi:UDP-N-acetylmuramoyl-L-alanyl-D-glutamate--2,6-diaminopimelate ligase